MMIRQTLWRVAGITLAIGVGAVLAVGGASAALAKGEYKYWPSSGDISVSAYGSTAYAHGQWRVADSSGGTRSFLDSYTTYNNADNHKKYALLQTQVGSSSSGPWTNWYADETAHSANTYWEWLYADTSVSGTSSWARAGVKVCLDIPFRSDVCTNSFTYTGSTNY